MERLASISLWVSLLYVSVFLCVLVDGIWFGSQMLGWFPRAIGRLMEGGQAEGNSSESGVFFYSMSVVAAVVLLLASGTLLWISGVRRK